jgi:heme-degrading monooxygenase HmoA
MHVLVVNFELDGVTEEEYRAMCDELAPAFAEVPGLVAKTWLADSESNTYGGVYMWRGREDFEAFAASELAAGVAQHPNLKNVTMRDFGVIEEPSAVTHGLVGAAA